MVHYQNNIGVCILVGISYVRATRDRILQLKGAGILLEESEGDVD
jgi:hypothetical protein